MKQHSPHFEQPEPSTAFSPRPSLRELVVVIDDELWREGADSESPLGLLVGLLSHQYIHLLRFAETGPPADAPTVEMPLSGTVTPGWLLVGDRLETHGVWPVTVPGSDGQSVTRTAIHGNAVDIAETDERTATYSHLRPNEAAARRREDAIAVQAAAAAQADIYVSRRQFLHDVTWDLASGVRVLSPEDALAVVSLYLRRQGVFVVYRSADGTATDELDKLLFFWVGARALLPAGWRWFGACVQAASASGDDSLIFLAETALRRFDRALRARDEVHAALNRPQTNETAGDAIANLDFVMLALVGALDVTARIANRALTLPIDDFTVGWRRKPWLKALGKACPELRALVDPGTPGRHTVDVLSELRNSIHGAGMNALGVSDAGARRVATLVELPTTGVAQIIASMDSLGGRERWGVKALMPPRAHADPGHLVDQAVRVAASLVDEVMRRTPVERLAPEGGPPLRDAPPDGDEVFSQWNCHSVLWQLDLAEPGCHDLRIV